MIHLLLWRIFIHKKEICRSTVYNNLHTVDSRLIALVSLLLPFQVPQFDLPFLSDFDFTVFNKTHTHTHIVRDVCIRICYICSVLRILMPYSETSFHIPTTLAPLEKISDVLRLCRLIRQQLCATGKGEEERARETNKEARVAPYCL